MKAKLLYALLAVVLLATAVGIGVHVLHKDALAQTTYSTWIGNGDDGFENIEDVQIRFKDNQGWSGWQVMDDDGGGDYSFVRLEGDAQAWQVEITDPNIIPDWPEDNPYAPPLTVHHFDWEVVRL